MFGHGPLPARLLPWIWTTSCLLYPVELQKSNGEWPVRTQDDSLPNLCRIETGEELEPVAFESVTCARCYSYIPSFAFKNESRLELCGDQLCEDCKRRQQCQLALMNATEESDIVSSFVNEGYLHKWRQCCQAAQQCCRKMVQAPLAYSDEPQCPRTWDGWTCFEDTRGATVVEKPCPSHAYYHTIKQPCQSETRMLA